MKIIKYLLTIIVLGILSCSDDFLDRTPLDEVSNETFFSNENDIVNYNNSLYDIAKNDRDYPIMMGLGPGPGVLFYHGIWWQDEMSDNLGATHPRAIEMYRVRAGKHNIDNDPRPMGYTGWDFIRSINFGLENYDRAGLSEEIVNRYKGEARLFRGWFYSDKVRRFGDVQWIDKVLNIDSEELFNPRDNRDFVMQKVLEDLDFAIAGLPEDWENGGNPGRVDKWVALAVKSRVCLFEGTWRKYHGLSNADFWLEQCVVASKELMDNGGFTLYSTGDPVGDYRYASSSTTQEGNSEVIYWRKYESLINGHFASRLFWNYNGGATKSFVEDVLCEDGLPISLSPLYAGDAQIEDVFVARDSRLRQCVLNPADKELLNYPNDDFDYPRLVGMTGGRNRSNTGYHVVKHWNAEDEQRPRNQHIASPPCLRLGEVFLNFAEAKAELGTLTQGDLDISINLLRSRVNMPGLDINPPMDPRYADMGVSSLIVEIRRERRVELFLEGHRYHDVRRWKQGPRFFGQSDFGIRFDAAAEARYEGANVEITEIDGIPYIDVRKDTDFIPEFDESRHYLWPIPANVISQNPNIQQNPGW
ncbi:RagB/SusD family nutrient uptake outer membrane protein [Flagellimonas eckloniae]|uniref:Carbohydrate-binding protein SusD n=1 Tax=Flagellimonas eckloniae TaxID=346185 RepID=A0A0Q1CJV9_9FLAO|nr:RagB/SusD family nutrient uptake outer membrane protein [Allomuricauda eckloniae]KQC31306.1 carbohydrate-binding protein SusD [Allomuricauda eckloniae]